LLLEIPSLTVLDHHPSIVHPIGPGANRGFAMAELPSGQWQRILIERGRRDPLVRFFDDEIHVEQFSFDGLSACGGSTDGRVHVLDFVEVQQSLAEFDLGW
jgi:hypothetical protein